ncbi:MAG TPA: M14 family zinc carboxypeptidase, partial [Burkholderiaceae bacterium]
MPRFRHDRFYRYTELVDALGKVAAEFPQLVDVQMIGTSHEGRGVPLVTITDTTTGAADEKPALWVDGNIHSVEVSASTACLYLIDWLIEGRDSNPDIARCLSTRAFYVCPRINPDGAEWALTDRPKYVRSSTRRYPFDEDPVSGLVVEDIDGDGRVLQMRIA